jgi:hypothetical protein
MKLTNKIDGIKFLFTNVNKNINPCKIEFLGINKYIYLHYIFIQLCFCLIKLVIMRTKKYTKIKKYCNHVRV